MWEEEAKLKVDIVYQYIGRFRDTIRDHYLRRAYQVAHLDIGVEAEVFRDDLTTACTPCVQGDKQDESLGQDKADASDGCPMLLGWVLDRRHSMTANLGVVCRHVTGDASYPILGMREARMLGWLVRAKSRDPFLIRLLGRISLHLMSWQLSVCVTAALAACQS